MGKKIIDSALNSGIKHIVNLSSMRADEDVNSPHLAIDNYLEEKGISFTHLRPNWFMQNFNGSFLESIKFTGEIGLYTDKAQMSFVDVRDIADVALKALENINERHTNKVYELTGPEALSHSEVAQILSKTTGLNIQYNIKSEEDTRKYLSQSNRNPIAIERMLVLLQQVIEGRYERISNDIENILDRPGITFEQYAKDYSSFFQS